MPDARAGAPGAGRKPVDQDRRAEGEERWTDEQIEASARMLWMAERGLTKDDARRLARIALSGVESLASRFEEVQTELAVWKKQSAAQVALAEDDVERAEAERDRLAHNYQAREDYLVSTQLEVDVLRADLERAQEALKQIAATPLISEARAIAVEALAEAREREPDLKVGATTPICDACSALPTRKQVGPDGVWWFCREHHPDWEAADDPPLMRARERGADG